jgi:hypothetical protein
MSEPSTAERLQLLVAASAALLACLEKLLPVCQEAAASFPFGCEIADELHYQTNNVDLSIALSALRKLLAVPNDPSCGGE